MTWLKVKSRQRSEVGWLFGQTNIGPLIVDIIHIVAAFNRHGRLDLMNDCLAACVSCLR